MNKYIDFHEFVNTNLGNKGFKIRPVTEEYIVPRLNDVMSFVNGILKEYENTYKLWTPKNKEWFLNPMNKKFNYSYTIEDDMGKIVLLNFSSVYGDRLLHNHCTYVDKSYRNYNLAKLHMIKVCQRGIEDNLTDYEGFWDKYNNGSIILHLKMGFRIESMRKDEQLLLRGSLHEIIERTYNLYCKESNESSNSPA